MNPNPLTDPRNRNYLIAGAGAAVAVIAFFLPFVTVSYGISLSFSGSQIGGILWLCELLELAAVAIAALFIFRPANPLGSATVPLAKQARWAAIGLTVAGGITFLILLLNMLNASSYVGGSYAGVGVSWGFGAILFLLGSIATVVGGVLLLMNKTIGGGAANYAGQYPYQGNPYASGQQQQYPPSGYPGGYQQQQPPQYPSQPPQYPSQQPQYPSQQPQYPSQPPQYPSQQPQYPSQQPQYPSQQPQYPSQQPQYPSQQQPPQYPQQ